MNVRDISLVENVNGIPMNLLVNLILALELEFAP